jgi:hypothetical protein
MMSDPMATRSSHVHGPDGAAQSSSDNRAAWNRPRIDVLPRLNELVLQTGGGIPGGGGTGGGGSTVIP